MRHAFRLRPEPSRLAGPPAKVLRYLFTPESRRTNPPRAAAAGP
jgi:hypothetical protein